MGYLSIDFAIKCEIKIGVLLKIHQRVGVYLNLFFFMKTLIFITFFCFTAGLSFGQNKPPRLSDYEKACADLTGAERGFCLRDAQKRYSDDLEAYNKAKRARENQQKTSGATKPM
ncbi:MAG: hypothetical protein IPF52_10035 [Saprospiraceae bacterium]|nr:hypothetical protein [Saprospiraceae bacterium]